MTTPVSAIVDLNYIKDRLGLSGSTDGLQDSILLGYIDSCSDVVEHIVGPVRGTTYDEWHDGTTAEILTFNRPIISITSVTEYVGTLSYALTEQIPGQSGLDAFGYFVFYDEGRIQRTAYGLPTWFAALPWWTQRTPGWMTSAPMKYGTGMGRVQVVYTAGRATVPAHIRDGLVELIRVNYQQTQQGGRRQSRAADTYDEPGQIIMGYFVPNRVREMLLPSTQSRGIR